MRPIQRFAACAFIPGLLILAGCGGIFVLNSIVPPTAPTSVAQYRAYGDSITAGALLSDPATQSYPVLVAEFEKVTFANNALGADQACDVPKRQIFPNADSPTLATHPWYTVLIGTNDVGAKGAGAYETVYKLCQRASISWLALPIEYKILANGSGVTTTGPGMLDTSNNWNAWTTQGLGSSVSFVITTTQTGPIYAWPRIDDNIAATYTYSLDGVIIGTGTMQTTPSISTGNGTTSSLGFLRLPAVGAGTHVVTFTQTNTGANGLSIVGIGTPIGPATNKLPTVLVGTVPYQLSGSTSACANTDTPCLDYIQDIEADINLFAADGLNVRLFDTRQYMFGTAAEMSDALHPNALGQLELSHSVETSW